MVNISGAYGRLKTWVNAQIAAITLRSLFDVDDAGIGDNKVLAYKTASGKHEYVAPSAGIKTITLYTSVKDIWRSDNVCDSSFHALIDGNPTATTVIYRTDAREKSLPDTAARPQFGKVILHNITRGNSRKITGVNLATKTLTTDSSVDNWANVDIITIGSPTCAFSNGHAYSRYFEIDVSDEVPANATIIMVNFMVINNSTVTTPSTNSAGLHPFESQSNPKYNGCFASVGSEHETKTMILALNNRKICVAAGAYGAIQASGIKLILRINGWWSE